MLNLTGFIRMIGCGKSLMAKQFRSHAEPAATPQAAGEDSFHNGHDESRDALGNRLEKRIETRQFPNFKEKIGLLA